jgi:hypothetical protein
MKLSEQLQRHVDLHPPGPIMLEHYASEAAAMEDQIAAVKAALREYHHGRDRSPAATPGMFRLSRSIETIFETPYVPTTATETGAES